MNRFSVEHIDCSNYPYVFSLVYTCVAVVRQKRCVLTGVLPNYSSECMQSQMYAKCMQAVPKNLNRKLTSQDHPIPFLSELCIILQINIYIALVKVGQYH